MQAQVSLGGAQILEFDVWLSLVVLF